MPILRFKNKAEFMRWLPKIRYYEVDSLEVIYNFNPLRRKREIARTKVGRDALAIHIEREGFNYEYLERQGKLSFTTLFASHGKLFMLGVFVEYPKGLLWWPVGRRG